MEFAIRRSANTIPAQLVEMMGPRTSFDFLKNKLNMYNLVERETINGRVVTDIDRRPMALGALSVGVTPLEIAGAYQIFGNGGTFTPTHSYTKVLDSNGEVVLEKDLTPTPGHLPRDLHCDEPAAPAGHHRPPGHRYHR